MKQIKLLFLIIGILLILPNAYAGWGDLGWGDCEGGWGDCEAIPEEKIGGATGSGGFSSPSEQIASVTSNMNQQLCLQSTGFDWFEETCYECDGKITKRNEQIVCLSCIEGYALIGEECKAINPQESNIIKRAREISLIDKYLDKFFPTNPLLGLMIIGLGLGVGVYGFINREVLLKRFKNGR